MIILGVTGSMAMGKSVVCKIFHQSFGVPIWDADETVRTLLATDVSLINRLQTIFPEVVHEGTVDRLHLREIVFSDPLKLLELEKIVVPRVLIEMKKFLQKMVNLQQPLCIVDVPLLFENDWQQFCTYTLTVSAHSFLQKHRILKRPGMTPYQMDTILGCQMPDEEKRRRADFVVQTGLSKRYVYQQVEKILNTLNKE